MGIERLCRGQDELYERMDEMDKLRNMARLEDAQVRANLYLGQIAVIGAILELSEKTGIHINGEIREYYRQNQDYLRNGVGMEPLHSVHKSKDRPKEKISDIIRSAKNRGYIMKNETEVRTIIAQPKWRSKVMWSAVVSQLYIIADVVGLWDTVGLEKNVVVTIVTAILALLVIVGVVNDSGNAQDW